MAKRQARELPPHILFSAVLITEHLFPNIRADQCMPAGERLLGSVR
jgi:hypothetical protein